MINDTSLSWTESSSRKQGETQLSRFVQSLLCLVCVIREIE